MLKATKGKKNKMLNITKGRKTMWRRTKQENHVLFRYRVRNLLTATVYYKTVEISPQQEEPGVSVIYFCMFIYSNPRGFFSIYRRKIAEMKG
jgi:hypothetical protein